ncbi:hypothetical protein Taro_049428, partial [Colocasia esculenta]|nr:hypothetical protein [Colocasia esculenta]
SSQSHPFPRSLSLTVSPSHCRPHTLALAYSPPRQATTSQAPPRSLDLASSRSKLRPYSLPVAAFPSQPLPCIVNLTPSPSHTPNQGSPRPHKLTTSQAPPHSLDLASSCLKLRHRILPVMERAFPSQPHRRTIFERRRIHHRRKRESICSDSSY